MVKTKILKNMNAKYILVCSLIILLKFNLTAAHASCSQLCNENWWANSSLKIIKEKLISSKNLNIRDDYGFRPLHFAVQNGEKEKVQLLLSTGVNTNAKTDHGFTPLYFAVGKKGDLEIIKMLIKFGSSLNVKDKNGITPLHYAAWGSSEKIILLLNAGADKNAITKSGKTAFDLALDNEELIDTEAYFLLQDTD
jgi:ankyrin repeat protein